MVYQQEKHWYEILCKTLRLKFIKLPFGKPQREKLLKKLQFCGLEIQPDDVYSTCVSIFLIGLVITIILSTLDLTGYALLILFGSIGLVFYVYHYPSLLTRYYRIKASSELVLSVLYMIVSLRLVPNLENAVKFAASNLSGPVGRDLKKMLWGLSTGKYLNAEELLTDYAKKWKEENFEFYQAIDMIKTSMRERGEKRERMLDESISILLRGNKERMKNYAFGLKNSLTIITMLGITLPILVMVLFPIMTIFMTDVIKPVMLVLFYNVILPVIVYWIMSDLLRSMPLQFGVTDISLHPKAHRLGWYPVRIGGKKIHIPLLPVAILVGALIVGLGIFVSSVPGDEGVTLTKLVGGLIILWGITAAIVIYSFFSYYKNIEIREEIREIESGFSDAMFQLGHLLYTGQPVEKCMERLCVSLRGSKIVPLFEGALVNIQKFGLTLKKALFDKSIGIIKYYPSKIVRDMLGIIVDSLGKGIEETSKTAIAISSYLKSVHDVEEYTKEVLGEITSNMSFMLTTLTPISCGIVVGLATVMVMVLYRITMILASITGLAGSVPAISTPGLLEVIVDIKKIVPAEYLLVIVGTYMLEVVILLSTFLSTLKHGGDPLEKYRLMTKGVLTGTLIFSFSVLIIYFIFGGIIKLAWSV